MTATSMLWRRVDTRGSLHMPPHDMLNGKGWEMVVGSVSPPLRRAIAGYAGFHEEFAAPIRRLETSSAFAKLILCFEGSVNAARPGKRSTVKLTAFAVGLGHAAMVARHDGRLGCLEVELSPGTAKTLLDDSPTLAGAGIVDLQDLWGAEASTLISRLCNAPDWTARFAVVDETLLARSAVTNVAIPADVQWAWNQIASSQGRVNISQLARDIGWSVGISPHGSWMPSAWLRRQPRESYASIERAAWSPPPPITNFRASHSIVATATKVT